jgi:predicted dithiol-disulfide oxidoreductase (DUF899 family)
MPPTRSHPVSGRSSKRPYVICHFLDHTPLARQQAGKPMVWCRHQDKY